MRHARVSVTILDRLRGLPFDVKAICYALLLGPHRTSAPGPFRGGPAALGETCETPPEASAAPVVALDDARRRRGEQLLEGEVIPDQNIERRCWGDRSAS